MYRSQGVCPTRLPGEYSQAVQLYGQVPAKHPASEATASELHGQPERMKLRPHYDPPLPTDPFPHIWHCKQSIRRVLWLCQEHLLQAATTVEQR
jgi:hypothetical protein